MRSSSPADPVSATGILLRSRPFAVNRRVLSALLMRELLTRYGRNNIGFLWLFIEPMLFTLVITIFWTATRSIHGSAIPIAAFALTGYSSVLLWRNLVGRCLNAIQTNKALLYHRHVTIPDVYFARIILEILAVSTSFVALAIGLYGLDLMPPPEDAFQVLLGWVILSWFGAGLALTIGGLSEKVSLVAKLWPPFAFALFAFSGVGFLVDTLPPAMRDIVLWLPMLNGLEYMRQGWFGSAFVPHYDIEYLLGVNLVLTFAGLSLIRQVGLESGEE
jgi:ABC-2 type transport system permease protein/capsular polysaccharide transport system permease protein